MQGVQEPNSANFPPNRSAPVAAPLVRGLVQIVEPFGVTRARLFEAARVDEKRLNEPFAGFEIEEFDRLQCAAMDLSGKETLGLRLASHVTDGGFGVVAHVVAHAPSLREALRVSARFSALLFEGHRIELVERLDEARLRCTFRRVSARSDRMFAEFVIAGLTCLIRLCGSGQPIRAAVFFEHAAPADRSEHHAALGEQVHFEQPFAGISFPRELLDATPLHHEPELYAVLYEQAEARLQRLGDDARLLDRLRGYLMTFKPSLLPSMEQAASAFGLSPRSLRRRLADEGMSFRALTRSVLATSAARSLRHAPDSLEEVAGAFGFADASTFSRAFKRWTGVTPAAFKRSSR